MLRGEAWCSCLMASSTAPASDGESSCEARKTVGLLSCRLLGTVRRLCLGGAEGWQGSDDNTRKGSGNAVKGSGNAVKGSGNAVKGSGNARKGSGTLMTSVLSHQSISPIAASAAGHPAAVSATTAVSIAGAAARASSAAVSRPRRSSVIEVRRYTPFARSSAAPDLTRIRGEQGHHMRWQSNPR